MLSAFVITVKTVKIMIVPFRDKEIATPLLETSYLGSVAEVLKVLSTHTHINIIGIT